MKKPSFSFIFAVTLAATTTLRADDVLDQAEARIQKYRRGEAVLRLIAAAGQPLGTGARVEIEQTRHKFLFGSNIFMLGRCKTPADNAAYERQFADLLNYATLPFYWWMYEPREGWPGYDDTEKIVQWCNAHQVTMKGHPLAWNEGQPRWLPPEPSLAMQLQLARVGTTVGRFKRDINIWDVVNEAAHFDRADTRQGGPTLTDAIRQMGVRAYLLAAFRQARNANPSATLVINDYETGPEYADQVVSQLVDEVGRPLYDVIGIQCHQHAGAWPPEKIWEICERFAKFGKPLHFTEATILSGWRVRELKQKDPQSPWRSTAESEREQAWAVARFYTILFSHPAVEAITWWDFSDQGAWLGAPAGLVREDMSPKPAYQALMNLIREKWWTKTETPAGSDGEVRFRGFYGDYTVRVQEGGKELTGRFSFDKATPAPIEVQLR